LWLKIRFRRGNAHGGSSALAPPLAQARSAKMTAKMTGHYSRLMRVSRYSCPSLVGAIIVYAIVRAEKMNDIIDVSGEGQFAMRQSNRGLRLNSDAKHPETHGGSHNLTAFDEGIRKP
jgi:hypothetical protein